MKRYFRKQRQSFCFLFVLAFGIISIFFGSCSRRTKLLLDIPGNTMYPVQLAGGTLLAQNRYFKFNHSQYAALEKYCTETPAAFEIELSASSAVSVQNGSEAVSAADLSDKFGFLYHTDFGFTGKLKKNLAPRPVVLFSVASFSGSSFKIDFCIAASGPIPSGFFVSGAAPYSITAIHCIPARIGFDHSTSIPVFAFSPEGGTVHPSSFYADLTHASSVFTMNTVNNVLPPDITITFGAHSADSELQPVEVTVGDEKLIIRRSSSNRVVISSAAFSDPAAVISVTGNEADVLSLFARAPDKSLENPDIPIKTDPGLIPDWNIKNWRRKDFELYEWDRFPGILFFDTADYTVQAELFRRLAFFVEKAGFRGTLLTNEELAGKHGYNAHDYSAASLARFFAAADAAHFVLNEREEVLRTILLENGVIKRSPDGTMQAGSGAVISVSQESSKSLRTTFIAHEGWHGLYFTDPDFRNTVASIFYTMDQKTLDFLIRYFETTATLNYDSDDIELMKNEFMAYMMQRPLSQTASYFINTASRDHAQKSEKELADYIIQTQAAGFVSAATLLDQYASTRWNLAAGRVWMISR